MYAFELAGVRVRHLLLSPNNAHRSRYGRLGHANTHGPFVTSFHPPPFATDFGRRMVRTKKLVRPGITPLMVA